MAGAGEVRTHTGNPKSQISNSKQAPKHETEKPVGFQFFRFSPLLFVWDFGFGIWSFDRIY
jgi:hypothetical protein